MKFTAIISLLAIMLLGSIGTGIAQEQKKCSFDIVGTWKAQVSPNKAIIYKFDADGKVTVLSTSGTAAPHQVATASYEVTDEPNTPKSVSFTATGKNRIFGALKKKMTVESYDDSSLTCLIPGMGKTRWTRVDSDRYFVVLSARTGEFYDRSGSAFQMAIKLSEGTPTIDAFGVYSEKGQIAFGAVPPAAYKDHLREARGEAETTLRLEINSRQYERVAKIIKEWQRRARENTLLYYFASDTSEDPATLNNILVVKAVTETLNQCSDDINLYKLDYVYPEDWIADRTSPAFIPFVYFRELRRRNEARHIAEQKFQELVHVPNLASR